MSNVSQKVVKRTVEQIEGMLNSYREEMDGAYLSSESSLSVAIGINYKPEEGDKVKITTTIKFVQGKISDSYDTVFDEKQDELFDISDAKSTSGAKK